MRHLLHVQNITVTPLNEDDLTKLKTIMHNTFPDLDPPSFTSLSEWTKGPVFRDYSKHITYEYGGVEWTLSSRLGSVSYSLYRCRTPAEDQELEEKEKREKQMQLEDELRNKGQPIFNQWFRKQLSDMERVDTLVFKDDTYFYTYKPNQEQWSQTYIVPP